VYTKIYQYKTLLHYRKLESNLVEFKKMCPSYKVFVDNMWYRSHLCERLFNMAKIYRHKNEGFFYDRSAAPVLWLIYV
jgi:hypothetical protein